MSADTNWGTQQLTEFLSAISSYQDEASATAGAIEHATEAVEAEVAACVRHREIVASVGFGVDGAPREALVAIACGEAHELEVDGLGTCPAVAMEIEDGAAGTGGAMVLARHGDRFSSIERNLLRGMARVLGMALRNLRTLAVVRERNRLLARLARIQRSISHHAPLQEVLDTITAGAAELLGDDVAGLALRESNDTDDLTIVSVYGIAEAMQRRTRRRKRSEGISGRAVVAQRLIVIEDYQTSRHAYPPWREDGLQAAMAAPVFEGGDVVGSLVVASHAPGRRYSEPERETLTAFAEHVGLALSDASMTESIQEALHDTLTRLANRSLFQQHLDQLAEQPDAGTGVALVYLDLDNFKTINDALGHPAGDELLVQLGRRLAAAADRDDLVCRLGGDEFGVVVGDGARAPTLAERILDALHAPFPLGERSVRVDASVGIAYGDRGIDDLLRNADLAMYRAKGAGGGRCELYAPELHAALVERLDLETELRAALQHDELEVHFQPEVDVAHRRVIGFEALVRWHHPERGVLAPADFLDIAETTGLMPKLTRRVLERSLRTLARWRATGHEWAMSVNLPASVLSDAELVDEVARLLTETGLPGSALQLEITEDTLMADSDRAAMVLARFHEHGVRFAIDDYGTGHSSLARLKSLPISELKIDRSFVTNMLDEPEDAMIVRSTVNLAHDLGLEVVAEGVEDHGVFEALRRLHCDRAQGFFLSCALDPSDVPGWLAQWEERRLRLLAA